MWQSCGMMSRPHDERLYGEMLVCPRYGNISPIMTLRHGNTKSWCTLSSNSMRTIASRPRDCHHIALALTHTNNIGTVHPMLVDRIWQPSLNLPNPTFVVFLDWVMPRSGTLAVREAFKTIQRNDETAPYPIARNRAHSARTPNQGWAGRGHHRPVTKDDHQWHQWPREDQPRGAQRGPAITTVGAGPGME